MKCNCSSINNYEIIGLCDIEKFNEKITEFNDKSWVQVSISDNSIQLGNRPSIKTINKTFADVKINAVKLINTPKSQQSNIEGLNLTGKSLLIVGEIIQKILYTSNSCSSHRINSFNIKSLFTTQIVVNENIDIAEDKFCIYICIEYSSITPINEYTLNQNATLFLFAHRTTPAPPYINEIILNNGRDEKVVEISFSTDDKKIKITSTGNRLDNQDGYFLTLQLVNSSGDSLNLSNIRKGEDGREFKRILDNQGYNIGDIVYISTGNLNMNNTKITNYPVVGNTYSLQEQFERFRITDNGFQEINNKYPNEIILKTNLGREFCRIKFQFASKSMFLDSFDDAVREAGSLSMIIQVSLYDSNGRRLKRRGTINGGENAQQFYNDMNYQPFEYGDIIEIDSSNDQNRIEISNFPSDTQNYIPKQQRERFRIGFDRLSKV